MSTASIVVLWSNGMVMVFNRDGQQMTDCNGRHEDVLAQGKLCNRVDAGTCYYVGKWGELTGRITKEEFFGEADTG